MASSTILEEVKTRGGIGLASDLVAVPRGAPKVSGHDMGEELKIGNDKGLEVGGRGAGYKLIIGKIEDSDTWQAFVPTVRTGVFGDVGGGGELEVGDTIAELDGFNPPVDIFKERSIQDNVKAGCGGAAFGGEDTVEE